MNPVTEIQLNSNVAQNAPFSSRYVLDLPQVSKAPRAATRRRKPRAGVVVRSDPLVIPKDRKGRPFKSAVEQQ